MAVTKKSIACIWLLEPVEISYSFCSLPSCRTLDWYRDIGCALQTQIPQGPAGAMFLAQREKTQLIFTHIYGSCLWQCPWVMTSKDESQLGIQNWLERTSFCPEYLVKVQISSRWVEGPCSSLQQSWCHSVQWCFCLPLGWVCCCNPVTHTVCSKQRGLLYIPALLFSGNDQSSDLIKGYLS